MNGGLEKDRHGWWRETYILEISTHKALCLVSFLILTSTLMWHNLHQLVILSTRQHGAFIKNPQ
jgi:hypothetical protein